MTCTNCGQEQTAGAFCSGCGARLPPAEQAGAKDVGVESPPSAAPLAAKTNKRAVLIVSGLGALLLAIVAVTLAERHGETADRGQVPSAAPIAAPSDSPHDICVRQLIATTTDIHDNQTQGYMNEVGINGSNDPYLYAANNLSAQFSGDYISVGAKAAVAKMAQGAAQTCSTTLNDQVRANFPTDGTFPSSGG